MSVSSKLVEDQYLVSTLAKGRQLAVSNIITPHLWIIELTSRDAHVEEMATAGGWTAVDTSIIWLRLCNISTTPNNQEAMTLPSVRRDWDWKVDRVGFSRKVMQFWTSGIIIRAVISCIDVVSVYQNASTISIRERHHCTPESLVHQCYTPTFLPSCVFWTVSGSSIIYETTDDVVNTGKRAMER